MTKHKALHTRDGINRVSVSRKEEGTGFISVEDTSVRGLEGYIKAVKKDLLQAASNINESIRTSRTTITRKQKWEEKTVSVFQTTHWRNFTQEDLDIVTKMRLQRETESLLIATQTTIKTNYIKTKIDNMQQNSMCMLCGDRNEKFKLIKIEYRKLAQKEC